jgi:hypothetical protein
MTTCIITLLCKINAIENIRAAVCAAEAYERDISPDAL